MYEEVRAFEDSYAEAKSWLKSKQSSMISRARTSDLTELEKEVADFTATTTGKLLEPGKTLMLTEAFRQASFNQQMGFTRFKTSTAAADGYAAISLVQRAITLQKNKRDGIISKPTALRMDPERIEGSIGMVAEKLSSGDLDGAVAAYSDSQDSIIKHSQIETILAAERENGPSMEAMRIVGNGDTCSYCKSLAGYWTVQIWTLRHFHNDCTCRIVTRNL
jgi:hypothetical protein